MQRIHRQHSSTTLSSTTSEGRLKKMQGSLKRSNHLQFCILWDLNALSFSLRVILQKRGVRKRQLWHGGIWVVRKWTRIRTSGLCRHKLIIIQYFVSISFDWSETNKWLHLINHFEGWYAEFGNENQYHAPNWRWSCSGFLQCSAKSSLASIVYDTKKTYSYNGRPLNDRILWFMDSLRTKTKQYGVQYAWRIFSKQQNRIGASLYSPIRLFALQSRDLHPATPPRSHLDLHWSISVGFFNHLQE